MPHIILEISENINFVPPAEQILKRLQDVLIQDGNFDENNIKSRIYRPSEYRIADGSPKNGFVHLTLKILNRHSVEQQEIVGSKLLKMLENLFPAQADKLDIAISVEVTPMNQNTYFKLKHWKQI